MNDHKKQLDAVHVYLETLEVEAEQYTSKERILEVGERRAFDEMRWRRDVVHDLRQRMLHPDVFRAPILGTKTIAVLQLDGFDDINICFGNCLPRNGEIIEVHDASWLVTCVTWRKNAFPVIRAIHVDNVTHKSETDLRKANILIDELRAEVKLLEDRSDHVAIQPTPDGRPAPPLSREFSS